MNDKEVSDILCEFLDMNFEIDLPIVMLIGQGFVVGLHAILRTEEEE